MLQLELMETVFGYLIDFVRNWLCEMPLINFICDNIYIYIYIKKGDILLLNFDF